MNKQGTYPSFIKGTKFLHSGWEQRSLSLSRMRLLEGKMLTLPWSCHGGTLPAQTQLIPCASCIWIKKRRNIIYACSHMNVYMHMDVFIHIERVQLYDSTEIDSAASLFGKADSTILIQLP